MQIEWASIPGLGDWDEAEHPRHPSGTSRGGQFREKTGGLSSGSERWVQSSLLGIGIDLDEDRLRDVVTRGREVDRTRLYGGSIGATATVTYEMPDGQRFAVVHKRQDPTFSDYEVWSSRIGRAMGAPVAAVIHDPNDEDSIFLPFIEGQAALQWASDDYRVLEEMVRDRGKGRRGALLGLLDIALLNEDRHGGNWMVDMEDNEWGIDHTHIAPWSDGDYDGYEDFGSEVVDGNTGLTPDDIDQAIRQIADLGGRNRVPDEWLPPMIARLGRLRDSMVRMAAMSYA